MYCSYEDLKTQVKEEVLLRYASDADGNMDEKILQNGIDQAQSEIDAYCRALYSVPFAPVPDIIRKFAVDIALYNIFSGRGFNFASESKDRIILVRYEKAIDFLKMVAQGKVALETGSGSGGEVEGNVFKTPNLQISSEKRIFGRSNMKGF